MCGILMPRSHIACNRSATSLRPKFRVVAGGLQGGCKVIGDWTPTDCRRLQGRFGCKEVLVATSETSATKSIVERYLVVADRLPTGRRLFGDWSPASCSGCRQPRHSFWSPSSRRSVAEWSPKSCRLPAIKKRSKYSRRPIANRLPIAPQLIADRLSTDRRRVGNHCPITQQYDINTRSLSAP